MRICCENRSPHKDLSLPREARWVRKAPLPHGSALVPRRPVCAVRARADLSANVSDKTRIWYETDRNAFRRVHPAVTPSSAPICKSFVVVLRVTPALNTAETADEK